MTSTPHARHAAADVDRRLGIPGLVAPTGPYAWTVTYGGLIHASGLRGIDEQTGRPVDGDVARISVIFRHLQAILDAHACRRSDVLASRVYVTDMARLRPLVNDAYEAFFGDDVPTRTILEVSGLNQNDTVEIEFLIADRSGRTGGHVRFDYP